MTTSKAITKTLLFPAGYFILGILIYPIPDDKNDGAKFILYSLLFCILSWVIGLFFGVVISAIAKSPAKEPHFYLAGQFLVIAMFLSFIGYDAYKDYQFEKNFGNIEHNRYYLYLNRDGENTIYSSPPYVKTAFNKLESEFPNKNDFRLTNYFSFWKDSVNEAYSDTLRIVIFTYVTNSKKEFFSKIIVFENEARIEILNGDPLTNQDYIKFKSENDGREKQQERQANDILNNFKKSLK